MTQQATKTKGNVPNGKRPPVVRAKRKPHPTQGWFALAQRATFKDKQ